MRKCSFISNDQNTCQFNLEHSSELVEDSNGSLWCKYHVPNEKNTQNDRTQWDKRELDRFRQDILEMIEYPNGGVIDFTGVIFPEIISFDDMTISNVIFDEAVFLNEFNACFANATFNEKASFCLTKFAGCAEFSNATFKEFVTFGGAEFHGEALFNNINFMSGLIFDEAEFHDVAFFDESKICKRSSFEEAKFHSDSFFIKAIFKEGAYFSNATFGYSAQFDEAVFEDSFSFDNKLSDTMEFGIRGKIQKKENKSPDKEIFRAPAFKTKFRACEFKGEVSFNNRLFLDSTDFSDAIFHKPPKFHGSSLHQDTNFNNASFPKCEGGYREYRTLKLLMGEVKDRQAEGLFFSLEQSCLQKSKMTPTLTRVASYLYGLVSNYGQSLFRPLFSIFILYILFLSLYYSMSIASLGENAPFEEYFDLLVNVFDFSLGQIFNPFKVWKETISPSWFKESLLLLKLLATIQSMFIFGLFSLFILSLRWNFKR